MPAGFGKFKILRQDLENSISCRQDWKIQYLAGRIWKIQYLASKICKIQYLVSKIWKIQNLTGRIWKIQDLAGKIGKFKILLQDWKIQYLVGRIWKIQDLAGRIWKIQYIVGKIWKIQYLATHHLLPRCSNSRRITHQLATPFLAGVTFFSFCFYPYLKRIKVLDIRTCQRPLQSFLGLCNALLREGTHEEALRTSSLTTFCLVQFSEGRHCNYQPTKLLIRGFH